MTILKATDGEFHFPNIKVFGNNVVLFLNVDVSIFNGYMLDKYFTNMEDHYCDKDRGGLAQFNGDILLWVKDTNNHGSLAHEVLHLVDMVLRHCEIPFNSDNIELLCHLQEEWINKIYDIALEG